MKFGQTGMLISQEGTFIPIMIAHQLGHIMGAAHSPNNKVWNPITPFGQGYRTRSGKFCTIMDIPERKVACRRLEYFSSPKITVFGETIGTFFHDASRWLRTNRFILAGVGDESMPCTMHSNKKTREAARLLKCLIKDPKTKRTWCLTERPVARNISRHHLEIIH